MTSTDEPDSDGADTALREGYNMGVLFRIFTS